MGKTGKGLLIGAGVVFGANQIGPMLPDTLVAGTTDLRPYIAGAATALLLMHLVK